jgi:hypothetical protein
MIGTRHGPPPLFGADLARRRETVQHRHLAVHQDHLVVAAGRALTACAPSCAKSTCAAQALEDRAGDLAVDLVVLDEQHPSG